MRCFFQIKFPFAHDDVKENDAFRKLHKSFYVCQTKQFFIFSSLKNIVKHKYFYGKVKFLFKASMFNPLLSGKRFRDVLLGSRL